MIVSRNTITLNFIFATIFLSLLDHTLNLVFGRTSLAISDGDLVLLSSRFVLRRNIQNSVGVNVKSSFDLMNTTRSRNFHSTRICPTSCCPLS
uniref:Secreted protein n=1 Tax=Meloidogyne incognita TaxID=6306 RepID=A0A914MCZ7_MELIC